MRAQDISEEVDPLVVFAYRDFMGMQLKPKVFAKKTPKHRHEGFENFSFVAHDDEVIGIPNEVPQPETVFHELVERIEIHVGEQL